MVLNFLKFSTLSQFFIVKLFNKSLLLRINALNIVIGVCVCVFGFTIKCFFSFV